VSEGLGFRLEGVRFRSAVFQTAKTQTQYPGRWPGLRERAPSGRKPMRAHALRRGDFVRVACQFGAWETG
jgi:hypothetical protein